MPMIQRQLIVDGMLSGTGIRDANVGGYVEVREIGISSGLVKRLEEWLSEYENAHYCQFSDKVKNAELDVEGIAIARQIREQLPDILVEYFSNAEMRRMAI